MVAAPTTTAHQPVVRTDRAVGREEAHRHLIDRMVSDRRPRALIVRGPLGAGRRQFARGIAAHLDGQGWTTRTVTLGRDGDAAEFVRALLHSAQRARTPNDEVGDATVALQQVLSRPGPLTDTTRKGLTFGVSRLAEALGPLEEPSLILLESRTARPLRRSTSSRPRTAGSPPRRPRSCCSRPRATTRPAGGSLRCPTSPRVSCRR
jgi:hypothetical protein